MHRSVRALLDGKTFSPTKLDATRFHAQTGYIKPTDGEKLDPVKTRAEVGTCKWVGALLERTYPGHPWQVQCTIGRQGRGGIIKLRINGLMPADRWWVVQLADTLTDPGGKRTVLAGAAALLEMYRIPRGNFDMDHFRAAMNAMPIGARLTGRGHLAPLIS